MDRKRLDGNIIKYEYSNLWVVGFWFFMFFIRMKQYVYLMVGKKFKVFFLEFFISYIKERKKSIVRLKGYILRDICRDVGVCFVCLDVVFRLVNKWMFKAKF